jgi:hypothetical protein
MQCALSARSRRNLQVRGSSPGSCRTQNDTPYRTDSTDATLASESGAPKASVNARGLVTLNTKSVWERNVLEIPFPSSLPSSIWEALGDLLEID